MQLSRTDIIPSKKFYLETKCNKEISQIKVAFKEMLVLYFFCMSCLLFINLPTQIEKNLAHLRQQNNARGILLKSAEKMWVMNSMKK